MSRGTKTHAFRIPDDLWNAAQIVARQQGRTVTDVVIEALERLIEG